MEVDFCINLHIFHVILRLTLARLGLFKSIQQTKNVQTQLQKSQRLENVKESKFQNQLSESSIIHERRINQKIITELKLNKHKFKIKP